MARILLESTIGAPWVLVDLRDLRLISEMEWLGRLVEEDQGWKVWGVEARSLEKVFRICRFGHS